jgi:hypothetical protein
VSSKLRIIVTGLIAEYPIGGMTWHYLQYVLGFTRMGHDVYYFEDSGGWPYDPYAGALGHTWHLNVRYLEQTMARYGLHDRWAYGVQREADTVWFGLDELARKAVVDSADLLINVSGTIDRPVKYRAVPRMVYIDTDPVFAQLRVLRGDQDFCDRLNVFDRHFSFGERVAEQLPSTGHRWLPTRQPVVLSEWTHGYEPRHSYTTVMNWSSYTSETYQGRIYGQKNVEFMRFLELPSRLPDVPFEVAGGPGHNDPTPRELIAGKGWHLVEPMDVCPDLDTYRTYIQRSRGEWSVAKNAYVEACSGWFSERSACYLASERPVIVQDTGFSSVLPTGEGLVAFSTLEEAINAVRDVDAAYARHSRTALEIAEECFDSQKILSRLLDDAFRTSEATPLEGAQ